MPPDVGARGAGGGRGHHRRSWPTRVSTEAWASSLLATMLRLPGRCRVAFRRRGRSLQATGRRAPSGSTYASQASDCRPSGRLEAQHAGQQGRADRARERRATGDERLRLQRRDPSRLVRDMDRPSEQPGATRTRTNPVIRKNRAEVDADPAAVDRLAPGPRPRQPPGRRRPPSQPGRWSSRTQPGGRPRSPDPRGSRRRTPSRRAHTTSR